MPVRLTLWLTLGILLLTTVGVFAQTTKTGKRRAATSKVKTITISDDSIRRSTEMELLQGTNEHDGSGTLYHVGTIESVPALLAVLQKYPVKNGTMICTRAHAWNALVKIAGVNIGSSYEDWAKWWDENKDALLKAKK